MWSLVDSTSSDDFFASAFLPVKSLRFKLFSANCICNEMWAILDIKRRCCLRSIYLLVYHVQLYITFYAGISLFHNLKNSAIIPESTNVFFHVKHCSLPDVEECNLYNVRVLTYLWW